MYLNLEAIRRVTFGALEVTEEEDGFHFYRFTKKTTVSLGASISCDRKMRESVDRCNAGS